MAALVALVLGIWGAAAVNLDSAWGWDEATNVGYPARRISLAIEDADPKAVARVLVECQVYPFAYPLAVGVVEAIVGASERTVRRVGRLLWACGLFVIFLIGRRLDPEPGALGPWLGMGAAALSPLAVHFSGTLFLEVPFLVASLVALLAWLARGPEAGRVREVLAGAAITVAFFTKFNYGVLFIGGLGAAFLIEVAVELRAGRGRQLLARTGWLFLVPALVSLWWFVWPWPAGEAMAASHRKGLHDFLFSNRDESMNTLAGYKTMHWGAALVRSPRWLLLFAVALLVSLPSLRDRRVHVPWIVFLSGAVPVALHPFHLDRFLLPAAGPLWALVGFGLSRSIPRSPRVRWALAVVLLPILWIAPNRDTWWLAERVGLANEEVRAAQLEGLGHWRNLNPARKLATNGMSRAESDALLGAIAAQVEDAARIGWVGMSHSFSPSAMHLGLMERNGSASPDFLAGRLDKSFVTIGEVDPGWDDARLIAWALGFDVILMTRPVDLYAAPEREFLAAYQERLYGSGRFEVIEFGVLPFAKPNKQPHEVRLFGLRPKR